MNANQHAIQILEAVANNLTSNIQVGHTTAALIGAKGYPGGEGQRFPAATYVARTTEQAYRFRKVHPGLKVIGVNQFAQIIGCQGAMIFDSDTVRHLVVMALDTIRDLEVENKRLKAAKK